MSDVAAAADRGRACPNCGSMDSRLRFTEPPFRIVQCRTCDLVYLVNPPVDGQLYDEYYKSNSLLSLEYRPDSTDSRLRELHAINTQRVSRLRRLKPEGRLLDVGCGRGFFLKTAAEAGYDVYGIDVSERAVTFAREAFQVPAGTETLENLVTEGASYDVVTLWHVLEHFVDPYEALSRVYALLTSGGWVMLEVPNLHSVKFRLARNKWEGGNHPRYHRTFFTAATLRRALEKSGFESVTRLQVSYRIPGRSKAYEAFKRASNLFAWDAFLQFAARKPGRG